MQAGDRLAERYRLDGRLGRGGMGEVWRGHDLSLDRSVAVKVLLESVANDEVVGRFRREATIGARLQHPGITVVHDVGHHGGRLFIVMELLAGEDLAAVLARSPGGLPAARVLPLAVQAAEALAAAHERSVVHRDLKPGNLFLLPGGRLKICDFGIAHSADATAGLTVTGRMFGTPAYMAPEQWRGEHVDARCDLYALGCVLFALLTGAPPFGMADQLYVLMRRHVEEQPRTLRQAGAAVPPELDRLVQTLLEKDPADRPPSAEAVATTLRGLAGRETAGVGAGTGVGTGVGVGVGSGSGSGVAAGPGRDGGASGTGGPRTGGGAGGTEGPGSGGDAPGTGGTGGTGGPGSGWNGTGGGARGTDAARATGTGDDDGARDAGTDADGPGGADGTHRADRPGPAGRAGGPLADGGPAGHGGRDHADRADRADRGADRAAAPGAGSVRTADGDRTDGAADRTGADGDRGGYGAVPTADPAGTGSRDGAVADPDMAADVTADVREFAVGLVAEAERAVRGPARSPHGRRVAALTLAGAAAARCDADLALRLLAEAERYAWSDAEGDGARVAAHLTTVARHTSPHAPARALRLLGDAQQALFPVLGAGRRIRLGEVAEELAAVAPERGALLAERHFEGPAGDRIWSRVVLATAAADPERAGARLARIRDPDARADAAAGLAGTVAVRDPAAALAIAGAITPPDRRVRALCRVARTLAAAGDRAGAAGFLERAGRGLDRLARDRTAELREEAAGHTERGELVRAEQLRTLSEQVGERFRERDPDGTGDPLLDACAAELDAARLWCAAGDRRPGPPDLAQAARRAADARELEQPEERAVELARIAVDVVGGPDAPWLPGPAAAAGTPLPAGTTLVAGADEQTAGRGRTRPSGAPVAPGGRRWHTSALPAGLWAAGNAVLWAAQDAAGAIRAETGDARWTAPGDDGVMAPPLPGAATVRCATDGGSGPVCVAVEPAEGPVVRLLGRELRDGRVRWWRDLPVAGPADPRRRPLFLTARGLVLYAAGEVLTALYAESGEPAWQARVPGAAAAAPTVRGDCLVVDAAGHLTGLHLPTGVQLWTRPRGGGEAVVSGSAPRLPAGLVHVLDGSAVRALHPGTGSAKWAFALPAPAAEVLVADGLVYAAGYRADQRADVVHALDADGGAVRWQQRLVQHGGPDSALALLGIRQGLLYVKCSRPGRGRLGRERPPRVTALDVASGRPKWHWEHPALAAQPALLLPDALILPLPGLTAIALP